MAKRNVIIGDRDIELLLALDRCPLTPAQLLKLSETFALPFPEEHTLRRRLRLLAQSGFVRGWPYAVASDGRSPHYYRVTRDGFRLLYGMDVDLPPRRRFEALAVGHHHHTLSLADFLVQTLVTAHRHEIEVRHVAPENSIRFDAGGFVLYPDLAFQLAAPDGRTFQFVVELDNGTERVRTKRDVESIERKLRGYVAHQSQFEVTDLERYLVLLITTRSAQRLQHMLTLAKDVLGSSQRTVFAGCDLSMWLSGDPIVQPLLTDHRGLRRTLIPCGTLPRRTSHSNQAVSKTGTDLLARPTVPC
jgi:hypothetical protein